MPRRIYIARDEKVFPEFKAAKNRLTLMLGGNAAGDYWFRNHFVPEVERYCSSKNIGFKVILIIDNAPGDSAANLIDPRVIVMFLLPNATSLLQPMEQGVIKTLKAYYTRRSFRRLNKSMNHDDNLSVKEIWDKFNILDAIRLIKESWDEISSNTLKGVWKKLCPDFFADSPETVPENDITEVVLNIVTLGKQVDLVVDNEDIIMLLESHDEELTVQDLIEMQQQNDGEDVL
ncbi:tigger transposable element-derived protein 1-like [Onthophagus taurus]|uniref:tigger transposable element-derived protein 1-like n=1 Tax=Onthophagus taurus TaxID=166361 RepID=UPI0039BE37B5